MSWDLRCCQQNEDWKENLTFCLVLSLFLTPISLSLPLYLSLWLVAVSGGDRPTWPANTHQCLCETENDPAAAAADLRRQCVKFTLFFAILSPAKRRQVLFFMKWSPSSRGGAEPVPVRDPGRGGPLGQRPPAPGLYDAANTWGPHTSGTRPHKWSMRMCKWFAHKSFLNTPIFVLIWPKVQGSFCHSREKQGSVGIFASDESGAARVEDTSKRQQL